MNNPHLASDEWIKRADELQQYIQDELEETQLWQVSREQLKYLAIDPFKLAEQSKFAPAHRDIEEASKCLAFDRGTACVFHLMGVMDCGVRALGESLNDPNLNPRRNPTWETILRKCDNELREPLAKRCDEWRQDDMFFSTATANLRAVKDAWRNPSLHVERDYTRSEAEDVWNAVRAFMRHLGLKLGGDDPRLSSQSINKMEPRFAMLRECRQNFCAIRGWQSPLHSSRWLLDGLPMPIGSQPWSCLVLGLYRYWLSLSSCCVSD